jgi:hypothetical protein
VTIFDASGSGQLNEFCAFSSHNDLDLPWFAIPSGSPHPKGVYLTLLDRLLPRIDTSNTLTLDPILSLKSVTDNGQLRTYNLTVDNRSTYPDVLFAPSPNLPACGENTSAARTWVDIYDQNGNRIYGFCALGSGSDLDGIWFAVPSNSESRPTQAYITLTDRLTNTVFTSNRIATP